MVKNGGNNGISVNTSTNSISRTHDSFFPKIKNTFDIEEDKDKNYNKKSNSSNTTSNFVNNIRMEDGISINILKNIGNLKIKKFFHIPSFDIYIIKVFIDLI